MNETINYIKVAELNAKIKQQIDLLNIGQFVVLGELSSFKKSGKNTFFKLLDQSIASIDCSYFNIPDEVFKKFKNGDKVLVTAKLNFYEPYGRISLIVSNINFFGEGELRRKFLELKEKLEKEGYFDDKYKKPIPKFVNNICVVTSKDGAVIKDIHTSVRKKNKCINIYLYDVRVQGVDCANSIIKALSILDNKGYDVILIARGGGSIEDLMGYNDENLVKAIFNAKTPIVSAVGHEIDYTLCDMVADKRFSTPTAAGEGLAYNVTDLRDEILNQLDANLQLLVNKQEQVALNISSNINDNMYHLTGLLNYSKLQIVNIINQFFTLPNTLTQKHREVINLLNWTKHHIETSYKLTQERFMNMDNTIKFLNPDDLLNKGYFRIIDKNNISLMNLDDIKVNDELEIVSLKNRAKVVVKEVENGK